MIKSNLTVNSSQPQVGIHSKRERAFILRKEGGRSATDLVRPASFRDDPPYIELCGNKMIELCEKNLSELAAHKRENRS